MAACTSEWFIHSRRHSALEIHWKLPGRTLAVHMPSERLTELLTQRLIRLLNADWGFGPQRLELAQDMDHHMHLQVVF